MPPTSSASADLLQGAIENPAARGPATRPPARRTHEEGGQPVLKHKKTIILGDRDGIPGPAIEACVKTSGAEVLFSTTECFV